MSLTVAAAGCTASLAGVAPQASAATLTNCAWSASKAATSAAGVSYTYALTAATTASLSSVTMAVPTGTAGTALTLGAVSPSSLGGGTVSLSGTTLTYSFTATSIPLGTAISIQVNGLTNTSTAGSYTAQITTRSSAGAVDTGTGGPVALTGSALTSPTWSSTSPLTDATGTSYTYTFTPPTLVTLITSITMTVPPGTTGSPTVGAVSPSGLAGGTVSLSGTTLTYTMTSLSLGATAISIQINGLTNTTTAGSYTSEIATNSVLGPVSTGVTLAVIFGGPLTLTAPGSLTWTGTLTGLNQGVVDSTSGDQQLTVSDATGTGAGWHVTVSATTFSYGTYTFSNTGTFTTNGSLSSVTASTAPSAACVTSCTLPGNTATYPVAVTTAATTPTPATIYDTAAGSGLGAITLGGHSAASPVGWWVNVPANARAGAYTSTVTVAIVSGP